MCPDLGPDIDSKTQTYASKNVQFAEYKSVLLMYGTRTFIALYFLPHKLQSPNTLCEKKKKKKTKSDKTYNFVSSYMKPVFQRVIRLFLFEKGI